MKQADFIHVMMRVLQGRTILQRQQLSEKVLLAFEDLGLKNVTVTVEIIEMETASYSKAVY